ncbi:LacI family transcriptional regulator [Jannaschia pagri]|uniref:LacI family transcriptional regulator n=1 Tax=Jannaschia pagri TaxID=2829797 RepID=A0ABQ4NNA6_9RHOB|nr:MULTISPECIES: substrate-binding domain-containing protein [unclassified Jannaschia]GIT92068.1 LacI family transcriptional regulator [Jannaschia sp. AI_61]GIT95903.1 LacI family transcriptional regulator [Jannaschia sp. AI_62]
MNLREFSELLGLSPTTVSRALGGYPEVKEETRRKVTEAARQHGYKPNRRAASLATGRAMAIGHVIPTSLNHEMVNPVFADFLAGAGEVYSKANYDIILSVVSDGDEVRAYRQMASTGSVDGIIVHGPRTNDARIALIQDTGLPFVVHGRAPVEAAPYSFVDVDNLRAFRRATDLLLDLGHQRIGLLNGHLIMDFARRRRDGYCAALEARGTTVRSEFQFAGEMSERNGYAAARQMLRLPSPPTAFLVSSLIMAIGARRAIHEADLTLGRDVSVVTHDDMLGYLSNGDDVPIFTATRSSVRAAGRRCAEILLEQVADRTLPPVQEIWESELIMGASTGPALS